MREHLSAWLKMIKFPLKPVSKSEQKEMVTERYKLDKGDEETLFCVVKGMGHTWPGGTRLLPQNLTGPLTKKVNANDVIWDFFKKHKIKKLKPVATYNSELDEDGQVDFKGKAKAFARTYEFLASILPYTNAEWEKFSIFLNLLIPKLPAPIEEDLSKGILEAIDMDSYRNEVQATLEIKLQDADSENGTLNLQMSNHKICKHFQ